MEGAVDASVAAVADDGAAAAIPAGGVREMRVRKPGPPLLEGGKPLPPAGKAKPKAKKRKSVAAGGSSSGKAGKAGSKVKANDGGTPTTTAPAAVSLAAESSTGVDDLDFAGGGDDDVFCICLGTDDGRSMVQCEGCDNWFHFGCIGLLPDIASDLAVYYCSLCEQAGSGQSQWFSGVQRQLVADPNQSAQVYPSLSTDVNLGSAALPALSSLPPLPPLSSLSKPTSSTGVPAIPERIGTPSESGGEYDDNDYMGGRRAHGSSSDGEYDDDPNSRKGHQRRPSSSISKRKRRVVEDDDDEEENKYRKQSRGSLSESTRPGASHRAGGSPVKGDMAVGTEHKTRKYCIEQLEKVLAELFAAEGSAVPVDQSRARAEAIEADLFDNFSTILEPSKSTLRGPGGKYTAKYRTLYFNVKSNDYFRSRIASDALDAAAVVAMNQEDLLTPEVRAEQQAMREQALEQSVKQVQQAPKTRITHKGEEVLDQFDQGMTNDDVSVVTQGDMSRPALERDAASFSFEDREQPLSASMSNTPVFENSARFGSPTGMSPLTPSHVAPDSKRLSQNIALDASFKDPPEVDNDAQTDVAAATQVTEPTTAPPALQHRRSESMSKSAIDFDKIWGSYKSPSVPNAPAAATTTTEDKDAMEVDVEVAIGSGEGGGEPSAGNAEPVDYDPFETSGRADDDFDALLNGDNKGAVQGKSEQSTTDGAPGSQQVDLSTLPTVWTGAVISPEEGGYPAKAVQIAGTPLGALPQTWQRLLPRGQIDLNNRIETGVASEYLVQNKFSSSRDIIIIALLPAGAPDEATAKQVGIPTHEKALARHAHLVKVFSEKRRYGVCPPSGELKRVVKDHYIVPLKSTDALPDYVELMDDHLIGENRTQDLLMTVLVINKGALGPLVAPPAAVQSVPESRGPAHTPQIANPQATPVHVQNAIPPQGGNQPGPLGVGAPNMPGIPGLDTNAGANGSQVHAQVNQPALGALDPAALQSLLANPSLMQALNTAPGPSMSPQMGYFSPNGAPNGQNGPPGQPMMPFNAPQGPMYPNANPGWQGPGGWPQQPMSPYGGAPYGGPPPPGLGTGQWNGNPAGSPPWQGGPPNQPMRNSGSWNTGPPMPPGNFPPDFHHQQGGMPGRDMHNRMDRDWREQGRDGGRDQGGRYERRDSRDGRDSREDWNGRGRYEGRSPQGGRSNENRDYGGRGRDRNNENDGARRQSSDGREPRPPPRDAREVKDTREKSGNVNQMKAGIKDSGWKRSGSGSAS